MVCIESGMQLRLIGWWTSYSFYFVWSIFKTLPPPPKKKQKKHNKTPPNNNHQRRNHKQKQKKIPTATTKPKKERTGWLAFKDLQTSIPQTWCNNWHHLSWTVWYQLELFLPPFKAMVAWESRIFCAHFLLQFWSWSGWKLIFCHNLLIFLHMYFFVVMHNQYSREGTLLWWFNKEYL